MEAHRDHHPASSWKRSSIKWRAIFSFQTWGQLLILVAGGIVTALTHFLDKPQERPAYVYDAQIRLPMAPKDTVPDAWAAAFPWLAFLITVAVVEFGVFYRRQSLTRALHAFGHAVFCCAGAFVVVLAITEASKPFASRLRPDYMARCQPMPLSGGSNATAAATATVKCRNKDHEVVEEGRVSFPSGHSSNSMSVCWFTFLYLVYSLYWRQGTSYMGSLREGRSCGMRLLMELANALLYIWGVCVLVLSWFIGLSRFHDNRHHISDIVGGFVLAALLTTPYFLMYAGQLAYYSKCLRKLEGDDDLNDGNGGSSLPRTEAPTSKERSSQGRGKDVEAGASAQEATPATTSSSGSGGAATTLRAKGAGDVSAAADQV